VWAHNKCTTIYAGIDRTSGNVVYVGITYDIASRQYQHNYAGKNIALLPMEIVPDRLSALLLEQGFITDLNLIEDGLNSRNNFSEQNWLRQYAEEYYRRWYGGDLYD
jgi:hypothetical protein